MMKPTKPGLSAILLASALLTDTEARADDYQLLTFTGETSANAAACSGPCGPSGTERAAHRTAVMPSIPSTSCPSKRTLAYS